MKDHRIWQAVLYTPYLRKLKNAAHTICKESRSEGLFLGPLDACHYRWYRQMRVRFSTRTR